MGKELINAFGNEIQNQRQQAHNRDMAQLSYLYNLDMWNRQNEYNLPANQMERLKDAGLNPHLVYGGGSAQTPAGTAQPPSVKPANITNPLEGMNLAMMDAQIANLNAETENKEIQNFKERGELGKFGDLKESEAFEDWSSIGKQTEFGNQSGVDYFGRFFADNSKAISRAVNEERTTAILNSMVDEIAQNFLDKFDLTKSQVAKVKAETKRLGQLMNIESFFEDMVINKGVNPRTDPNLSMILKVLAKSFERIGIDLSDIIK